MAGPPEPRWVDVDRYVSELFEPPDDVLTAALAASDAAGLPSIHVTPSQGRLLWILARSIGAQSILEVGTLAGYSAIWLARALPAGGRLVTLEANARHAAVARANITQAGLSDVVDLRVGRAGDTLSALVQEHGGPFDLIFIDADKPSYPDYLRWAVDLARPGSLIIADNIVRDGAVADASSTDASVQGVRRFNEDLAAHPRLSATVVQTVGSKGYDGFAIAIVS